MNGEHGELYEAIIKMGDRLSDKIDKLGERVDKKFDKVDGRVDKLEQWRAKVAGITLAALKIMGGTATLAVILWQFGVFS